MGLLTQRELERISARTSRELAQRWRGMEKKIAAEGAVTIANTGLVNSGKSSLFNALLDRGAGKERFPVGAVRTTKRGDREHLLDWLDILDTPGIDATDEDDDAAYQTLMEADLIVATHNIKLGMLNKSEYEWLSHLSSKMGAEEVRRRIIFVCTWIDERERDAAAYQSALQETERQVTQALGTAVPFWKVSAKRYVTAKQKGNAKLETASNIPQLKAFLMERAGKLRETAQEERRRQLQSLCQETRQALQQEQKSLHASVNSNQQKVRRRFATAYQVWDNIFGNFKSKRVTVEDKLMSLESEIGGSLPGLTGFFGMAGMSKDDFVNKIKNM